LRYVISSPAFHRWHHTSASEGQDKNFAGFFPIWDLLFGTFYMPKGRQPTDFGISDPIPGDILRQLIWPFRRKKNAVAVTRT
jgi:sterol desaturase/sphingolipid hydroxylase (fatty acid hydroxylase superfamily)